MILKPVFPCLSRAALLLSAALFLTACAAPDASKPGRHEAAPQAAVAPQAAPGLQRQAAGVSEYRLPNGMTLLVKPDRRSPTAVHMLWLRVGSMDEVSGHTGLAHILEHMMFKGSERLAPGEFSRRVAALGGQENAFTSLDYTGFYQQVPVDKLTDVMALEADRFAHSQWPDEEFSRELEVVKEERRLRTEDNPRALLHEQQMATAFMAAPYHHPVVGWMGDLEASTADDVRDFYQRWYQPANAAIVVVGDVEPEQVHALALEHYGGIDAAELPARKPQPEPEQRGMRRIELQAPVEQMLVSLVFKAPGLQGLEQTADNDDALALTVLAGVLDGYRGARLERALTQGADRVADFVNAGNGLIGRGPQVFVLSAVAAPGKTPEQLQRALLEQVQRIAREGVDAAELQRVKTQWMASQVYERDSVMGQAQSVGFNWVQGLPIDADDRLLERLQDVTAEQVQAVAEKYFVDKNLTMGVLLPQKDRADEPPVPVSTDVDSNLH